jgi:Luciferase
VSTLLDDVVAETSRLSGVEETRSRFGEAPAFCIDGREFMHIDRNGLLDIRLTRPLIRELDDDRLIYRPRASDWVWVRIESRTDVPFALELVRQALAANAR